MDLSSVTSLQCLRIEATAGNVEKLKLPSHCQLHVDLWDYATAMNGFDIVHKTLQMHAVALSSVCMNKILIGTGKELVVLWKRINIACPGLVHLSLIVHMSCEESVALQLGDDTAALKTSDLKCNFRDSGGALQIKAASINIS